MEIATHPFVFDDNPYPCVDPIFLQEIDRYIFWIGGTMTLMTTSFLIIGSIRFKELRRQPGDLILGIALSDFILSIHWLILATYHLEISERSFCVPVGALGTFAGINEFLYNSCFSIFLIVSLRNALKQAKIPKKSFHVFNLVVSIGYLIDLLVKNEIGRTLAGTCSIRSKCSLSFYNYVAPLLAFGYGFLGAFTYYYVKKNMPRCGQAHSKRTQFLNYYLNYNIACSIIYTFVAVTNVLDTLAADPNNPSQFNWANSLYNVAKLCSPLVLSIIRYNDPTIKAYMWRTIAFWKGKPKSKEPKGSKDPQDPNVEEPMLDEHNETAEIDFASKEFMFNELSSTRRVEFTYTLLSCVLYANHIPKMNMRESLTPQTADRRSKNPYKHEKVFLIEEGAIFNDLPAIKEEMTKQDFNILSGTLKVYSPEIFAEFIRKDREKEDLNVSASLDFEFNREQIMKASGADGGKSGEFFFFSRDKRLILKTVPAEELKQMINILERYEKHFEDNENTLIAKMYGVYTYETTDLGLKFNLVLLKNICGFPSNFVYRTFDMKGSTYDRETLKPNENPTEEDLRKLVLKDTDFVKLEGKLKIGHEFRESFLKQIRADSEFFRSVNLIDYSFMVFMVNKHEAFQSGEIDQVADFTANNELASIRSASDPEIYYNMGIIDYLQPYNFNKAFERFLKRVKKLDPNLDTSSQDPQYYSERFIRFIEDIVLEDRSPQHLSPTHAKK